MGSKLTEIRKEDIDHAAEARKVATPIENNPGKSRSEFLAEAQLHATLALMEQQKVANLIAYTAMLDNQFTQANDLGVVNISFQASQEDVDASLARHQKAQVQLREGLGL